jgi:hypothetical protein
MNGSQFENRNKYKANSHNNMMLRPLRLLCANTAVFLALFAADSTAIILYPPSLTQDSVMVGDRIGVRISIIVPVGAVVSGPEDDADFGKFIVKERSVDKSGRPSSDSLSFNYLLTTYTAEPCTIPALSFVVIGSDSAADTVATEPLPLKTILLVSSDTADLKDLRPQQKTGKRSLLPVYILMAAAVGAALFWFLRRFIKKIARPEAAPPPKPPYEEAMDAFKELEAKQYLLKGMIREYVFELSEILKRYAGRRFEVNALDFTTEEMLEWLEKAPVDKSLRRSTEWFFVETEPVKFAKQIPEKDTVRRFGEEALSFIEKTRPVLTPEPAKNQDGNTGGGDAVQKS